ncbi:MAG: hypothetical protein ACTSSE_07340 [Candidatus Thorarchaeota archaeon]
MIVEWSSTDRSKLFDLFESFKVGRRVIFPALLQNRGNIWVDPIESPNVARLQLGVLNALAGDSRRPVAADIIKMITPHELIFF